MEVTRETPNDIVIGDAAYETETLTADLTGTAATITDTTTYAVTDQDTLTSIITVTDGSGESWDGVAQTVLFSGTTTTAASVAAQMNDGLNGCSVAVVGGQVKITTDKTGGTVTVAAAAGTGDLTWATPVAGTGQTATWLKGTILSRNTSTKKLVPYVDGGSTGINEPVAVLTYDVTFTASGDRSERPLIAGKVDKDNLVKHDDSTAIDTLVFDKLIKNSGIVPISARDHSAYDNE